MLRKFFLICFCLASLFVDAQRKVEKIEGFSHPESAYFDGDYLYVSDYGKNRSSTDKDGDGVFYKKWYGDSVEWEGVDRDKGAFTLKPMHAPKGFCVQSVGEKVHILCYAINDINKIIYVDLNSNLVWDTLNLDTVSNFLNDAVALSDDTFFVSAMDKNSILQIITSKRSCTKLPLPPIKGANGLCLDKEGKNLYCVSYGDRTAPNGEIWKINLATLKAEQWGQDVGYLDGCAIYRNRLYFSDWVERDAKKGRIRYMDLDTHAITTLDDIEPIGGPADFCLDEDSKTLYVPALLEGVVYKINLE